MTNNMVAVNLKAQKANKLKNDEKIIYRSNTSPGPARQTCGADEFSWMSSSVYWKKQADFSKKTFLTLSIYNVCSFREMSHQMEE